MTEPQIARRFAPGDAVAVRMDTVRDPVGGHYRTPHYIRGKRGDFQEVYPDEGDMDMFELARTLRDVGYEHLVMPDHVPRHAEDPGGHQGFAYSYGYIKALIQVLKSEA